MQDEDKDGDGDGDLMYSGDLMYNGDLNSELLLVHYSNGTMYLNSQPFE